MLNLPATVSRKQADQLLDSKHFQEGTDFVCWKDNASVYQGISKSIVSLFNLKNRDDMVGIRDYDLPCPVSEFGDTFVNQDQKAMQGQSMLTVDIYPYANGNIRAFLSRRAEVINQEQETIGVFCHCRDITQASLTNLAVLSATTGQTPGLSLELPFFSITLNQSYETAKLSKREGECLFYLLRGYSATQTGQILCLSPRTVEGYINSIKLKFNCHSKVELIEKAINLGYINILPPSLMTQHTVTALSDA